MGEPVSKPLQSAASPGIIFDLDGTLANTIDDIADCVNQALTDAGRSAVPLQRIRELKRQIGKRQALLRLCEAAVARHEAQGNEDADPLPVACRSRRPAPRPARGALLRGDG